MPQALSFTGSDSNVVIADGGTMRAGCKANTGTPDIFIGVGGALNVKDSGILLGDGRNEGGTFQPGTLRKALSFTVT